MKMLGLVVARNQTLQYPSGKGRRMLAGECFQATERDARILIALRKAQLDAAGRIGEASEPAPAVDTRTLVHAVMDVPLEPRKRTLRLPKRQETA
jgi:hypothetical protein